MAKRPCPLHALAVAHPKSPAFVSGHGVMSFAEYDGRVAAAARRLWDLDVGDGDIVGICLPTGLDASILIMAIIRAGATALPINPRFPASLTSEILQRVGCRTLITSDKFPGENIRVMSPGDFLADSADIAEAREIDANRPAVLVLTSGSSGTPKVAALSFDNLYINAQRSNKNIALAATDRWLLSLPTFHVSGLGVLFRCLAAGAPAVIPEKSEDLADTIKKYAVTHVSLVPTQLYRMMQTEAGRAALARLKAILLGGSAIPRSLLADALAIGLPIHTTYGMTEMASQIATTARHDLADSPPPCKPLAEDTLRINRDGEIEVRGETRFLGYLNGAVLEKPFDAEGWFKTGDLGTLREDGSLTVFGRRDNMFVVGGENVQPEAVERCLVNHPDIMQARVVPVPDAEFGNVPVAFVEGRAGVPLDAEAIMAYLGEHLPRFAIPRHVFPWPEIPDGSIKPRTRDLIALATSYLKN